MGNITTEDIESLNATIQEVNNAVQKLTSQVSVMGSKVYESKDAFEESTAILQAYTAIKRSIHLHKPQHEVSDADIVNGIEAFRKSINIIRQKQSTESNFGYKDCGKIIIDCLSAYSLKLSSLTSAFLQNIDVLCDVLNRKERKEEVIQMFIHTPEDLITVHVRTS